MKNNEQKNKKKKDEVKMKLFTSFTEDKNVCNQDSNKGERKIKNIDEAILVATEYKKIVKTKKYWTLNIAYRKCALSKRFEESDKFIENMKQINVGNFTVYSKKKLVKIFERYPNSEKSPLSLS